MNKRPFPKGKRERRALTIAAIILLQALTAMFFVGDVFFDLRAGNDLDVIHSTLELIAALALTAGVALLMFELRDLFHRMAEMDVGLQAARGGMADLINAFFDDWQLTPSEREIALFILKGVDNETIAGMRGTAQSTVRAQSARIYAKAKVDSRAQLLSIFMEELLSSEDTGAV